MSINLLIKAVRENYIEVIELILKKIDVNSKDDDGRTPLHWAALYGHTDIVKELIEAGAELHPTPLGYRY